MSKKKIFFVTSELPGRFGGSNSRNFNILKFINKSKFDISLFTLIEEHRETDLSQVENELKIPIYNTQSNNVTLLTRLFNLFFRKIPPTMQRYANSKLSKMLLEHVILNKPDIIQIEQLTGYYAIKKIIPDLKKMGIKLVFDEHNVEYIAFLESLSSMNYIKRMIGKYIFDAYKNEEISALNEVDYILVCSDNDKRQLSLYCDSKKISVIPNAVDCTYFKYKPTLKSKRVLFMGGMNYPPNKEAIKFYLFKIHKLVKQNHPDYKLLITGKPDRWLYKQANKDNSIVLSGFVPDVRNFLHESTLCICPILSGSGTRTKILEYLASGRVVISTSKGAEGLNLIDKKELFISDQALDFSGIITSLLSDNKILKALEQKSRKKIEDVYNWDKNILKLQSLLQIA